MLWFIIGIIVGAGALWLLQRTRDPEVTTTWYGWVLGILGAALILLSIEAFNGSLAESEPQAAWMSLLTLGLPGVILAVLAWWLPGRSGGDEAESSAGADAPDTEQAPL
ncbi:MAG: hypothetical protein R6T85_10520 [Egibacteraceae bacterium]